MKGELTNMAKRSKYEPGWQAVMGDKLRSKEYLLSEVDGALNQIKHDAEDTAKLWESGLPSKRPDLKTSIIRLHRLVRDLAQTVQNYLEVVKE